MQQCCGANRAFVWCVDNNYDQVPWLAESCVISVENLSLCDISFTFITPGKENGCALFCAVGVTV